MSQRCALVVAAAALWAAPAAAAPVDYSLEMEAVFLGMTVANVAIRADDVGGELAQSFSVETLGLVHTVSGFRSEATALSRMVGDDLATRRFATASETKRATREVAVRYDDGGRVVEVASFERGKRDRSEVPAELRHHTIDPLTAIPVIRRWLAEARDGGPGVQTTIPVFDGRRRYDLEVFLVDRRIARFAQGPTPVIELAIALVPLAGFDQGDDDGRRREVVALISDDADLLPLILRTTASSSLQASLYTRRACTGGELAGGCREFRY